MFRTMWRRPSFSRLGTSASGPRVGVTVGIGWWATLARRALGAAWDPNGQRRPAAPFHPRFLQPSAGARWSTGQPGAAQPVYDDAPLVLRAKRRRHPSRRPQHIKGWGLSSTYESAVMSRSSFRRNATRRSRSLRRLPRRPTRGRSLPTPVRADLREVARSRQGARDRRP